MKGVKTMIYTVRPGDTLAEIASRFGIPLDTLIQLNPNILDANQINIGQEIFIPDDEDAEEPTARPRPRPIRRGTQYALRRVNNLLVISFANKNNYSQGETIVLYLIKVNIGNSPITLHYSTTQRFDFTASANNQQWTWSRGRAFGYQQADVVIEPGECEVYTANWDQEANNGSQMTGNINITGWNIADRLENQRLNFTIRIR